MFLTPAATKEEQLEYEMSRLAENRHLTSPPPQETKPDITGTQATKQEQLEYELSRLAQNNRLASSEPIQEMKPNVKEEQLLLELEMLAASGGMVPPERRPRSTVKPDPDAQAQVKRRPLTTADEDERRSRRVKEEQLELEMARLARSASSTPALSVKQEPGGSSRNTAEPSVGPLEGSPLVAVKPEEGSSTPSLLKRSREGQDQQGEKPLPLSQFVKVTLCLILSLKLNRTLGGEEIQTRMAILKGPSKSRRRLEASQPLQRGSSTLEA
ncbi:hypothetical protein M407DRAFT_17239 [Tulasnella calospora MUT 4182]|uniref:Uncharacterized protein n=1 Tax=Tulasnella calospora MUT 4182 TaxID=1051891 RepID=A0A0C3QXW9_9AGAM|nr:hypothetical protein M407DRAFT_17239 [Tulasnella calospora MUT 4182]